MATRGSKLSLAQTDSLIEKLREKNPDLTFEKNMVMTQGDKDKHTALFRMDQKGIFEKEVNQAVLEGRADFAVHSMKDLPVYEEDNGLIITGEPKRGSVADVLVSRNNQTLEKLPPGSVVGTSSLLRIAQLRRARSDLETRPIRGNVETRILKVEKGEYDAVILAEAGLDRLGLESRIAERLTLRDFMPAPGQGIIAPVAKRASKDVIRVLETVEDSGTMAEGNAERELVRILEGGCKVPIGAIAEAVDKRLKLTGCVLSADGKTRLEVTETDNTEEAVSLGKSVAEELLRQGAKSLERSWREILG